MGETVAPAGPTELLALVRSAAEASELPTAHQENLLRAAKTLLQSSDAERARLPDKELPRELIADRYELVEELGRGGMGVVYRAYDRNLRRDVALKVLLVGESEGKPFYVMELVGGKELSDAIDDHELSPRDAIELTRQLAEALEFAHARGILHRDIKPRNALVDWRGRTDSTAQVVEPAPPEEGTAETQLAPQDADTSPAKGSTRAASACLPGLTAKLLDELHDAEQKREEHFATAVSAYSEAVAFWGENPHARERLGDLYWDRYLRAEKKRNVADQRTYKELVRQFAWEKYEAPMRGEKEVSVTFLLPESFAVPQSDIRNPKSEIGHGVSLPL